MDYKDLMDCGKEIFNFHPSQEFNGADNLLEAARNTLEQYGAYERGAALFAKCLTRYVDELKLPCYVQGGGMQLNISSIGNTEEQAINSLDLEIMKVNKEHENER